jgi:hypothetical protein
MTSGRRCASNARFALLLGGILFWAVSARAETRDGSVVGGAVKWARLKTDSPTWDRHARSDPRLLEFMRTHTSLDIDPNWYVADVENLNQMCAYPFLFSEGLHHVTDEQGLANLHEYFKRYGFIFIDACINTGINPDPDAFLQMEVDTLKTVLPDAYIERLPPDSEIFHNVFLLPDGLPHSYMNDIYNPTWAKHGLYAVYSENRLVSIISLSGLQCGWDGMKRGDPEHITNCMKMMINIYTYVTMH